MADSSHPELEAMRSVHKALEPLDAEARARVLSWVTSTLDVKEPPLQPQPQKTALLAPGAHPPTIPPSQTIEAFVASKRPTDTYQRLAALAYFLEHHEHRTDITGKDLTKANTDARQVKISNMAQFLDLATRRHGYFTSSSKGKKRLSSRGKALVEALPDQTAAKEALAEHPLPKKGGRKAKKKK